MKIGLLSLVDDSGGMFELVIDVIVLQVDNIILAHMKHYGNTIQFIPVQNIPN